MSGIGTRSGNSGRWGRSQIAITRAKKVKIASATIEKTADDLYYVQNYSIWLDVYILMKTLFIVLRGKGAY